MSELNEIAKALAAAQAEMANPGFDSANPHFRNKFASLAAVRNAVVPILAKHGISLTQNLETKEGAIACSTLLTHASGQQMVFGPLILPATKADAQGYGSAATYARRYSMMAVAGVVGDEDDDAEAAVGRANGKNGHDVTVAEQQVADLNAMIEEVGADRDKFLAYMKLKTLGEMRLSDFPRAVAALQKKRAQ